MHARLNANVRCHVAAYFVIASAFVIGFTLRALNWRWWFAWVTSALVVPIFVLAIVLMKIEGWEWWPVAIVFGSIYGAAAGAL